MDPLAGMDDSSTDDDNASQTTEDDPQVPEHDPVPPVVQPPPPPPSQQASKVQKPNYQLRHTLIGHTKSISAVKFSPDGTLLASCGVYSQSNQNQHHLCLIYLTYLGAENAVKIWSPFTGELIRDLTGHTEGLSDISWSSDSFYLASASDDKTIRIWEVDAVCSLLHDYIAITPPCNILLF
jgi:COMPASS component SWD3